MKGAGNIPKRPCAFAAAGGHQPSVFGACHAAAQA